MDGAREVEGPLGARGALVEIRLFEESGLVRRPIGRLVVGDLLRLSLEGGGRLVLRVSDCDVELGGPPHLGPAALEAPPSYVLAAAGGLRGGVILAEERALRRGDRVRVSASDGATGRARVSRP